MCFFWFIFEWIYSFRILEFFKGYFLIIDILLGNI